MKFATILADDQPHQQEFAAHMAIGLSRHDFRVAIEHPTRGAIGRADLVACWGVKHGKAWEWRKRYGRDVLVMERGALEPRREWTSFGLNGLAGHGAYAPVVDGGARWRRHFESRMQAWRTLPPTAPAVICGQCKGDAATAGVDLDAWAQRTTDALASIGRPVLYRAHPVEWERGNRYVPMGARAVAPASALAASCAHYGAGLVVTWNSTAAVEAVLAGFPTVAYDAGSMAWAVTSHDATATPVQPAREKWAGRLAWTCFSVDEIRRGVAWAALKPVATVEADAA